MRICALNGSLRGSRGVTSKLLQSMGAGVESAGGSWDVVHLAEQNIESCLACGHCQKSETHACVFDGQDDASMIFGRMLQADLLVYASPVYTFGISSLLKRLLERMYSFAPIDGLLLTKSGLFFHTTDRQITGKPFVTIVACNNMENLTVHSIKEFFRVFGLFMDAEHVGHLERRSASAWMKALEGTDAKMRDRADEVVAAYAQAGSELVSQGRISEKTKRIAKRPFVHIPFLVLLARHVPLFRPGIDRVVRNRSGLKG